jgi:hypothetical protein
LRLNRSVPVALHLRLAEPELEELRLREVTPRERTSGCIERFEIDITEVDRLKSAMLKEDFELVSVGRGEAKALLTRAAMNDPSG